MRAGGGQNQALASLCPFNSNRFLIPGRRVNSFKTSRDLLYLTVERFGGMFPTLCYSLAQKSQAMWRIPLYRPSCDFGAFASCLWSDTAVEVVEGFHLPCSLLPEPGQGWDAPHLCPSPLGGRWAASGEWDQLWKSKNSIKKLII